MRRILKLLGAIVALLVLLVVCLAGWGYWKLSNPQRMDALKLPAGLIDVGSKEGKDILDGAIAADHKDLSRTFQVQEKGSWCGVASAVAVLNARGAKLTQDEFFTPEVVAVRPWRKTTFGGMTLPSLGDMLRAHGASAAVTHASESSVQAFRDDLKANAAAPRDWLIVNYNRKILGEAGGGHLSPVSAYSSDRDALLLLDTAGYKYPAHWVPVEDMFKAMNTIDSENKRSRGWVVVN